MMDLELMLLIGGLLAAAGGVFWWVQRQREALIAFVRSQGWRWIGTLRSESEEALPPWCVLDEIPRLRIPSHKKAAYRKVFTGDLAGKQLCGFERSMRRRTGKDESQIHHFLLLRDRRLQQNLPDFFLVRSHPLTDTWARLDSKLGEPVRDAYRIHENVRGYEAWRVHATPAGADWLASAAGQHLGRHLDQFDAIAQHAFGVSGKVFLAEGLDFSPKRLQALIDDLRQFHTLVQQCLRAEISNVNREHTK